MEKVLWIDSDYYLRFAESKDLKDLFIWRNDKETREASFNTKVINIKDHTNWFKKSLEDPEKKIFIICFKNGEKLGQIRFDKKQNYAIINITLDKRFRNKGIGSYIINKSSDYYLNNYDVKTLISKIKDKNQASLKSFQKAGYKIKKRYGKFIELIYEK